MNRVKNVAKPLRWFMALLLFIFVAGCGSGGAPVSSAPVPGLVSIAVTPATASIPIAGVQQFTATATYANGSTSDVTTSSTWTSGNPGIATVAMTTGVATGVASGTSVVTAAFGGQTATATLTVTAATLTSIAVTPATASIPITGTQPFTATATYSDLSTINVTTSSSWTSGTPGVATVNSTSGVATGVASGTSVITATFGGQTAAATLTVTAATLTSIAVTPTTASIQVIDTQPFTATATYSDLTTAIVAASWASNTPGVATVNSASGVATGVASGTSVITATFGGQSATATLTVTAATLTSISVTPATALIPATGAQQYTATAHYSNGTTGNVTAGTAWVSANVPVGGAAVASLSTDGVGGGLATGNVIGQSLITATFNGQAATATLNVTVNLGRATNFGVVAGTGLTNAQVTTITGDVGAPSETAAPTMTAGYNNYVGAGSAPFTDALSDLTPAITAANVPACTTDYGNAAKDYGNLSLAPGIYCNGAGAINITGGPLGLNAPGVYIFRTGGALTPAQPVIFTGVGMTSANTSVFWIVGSASTATAAWKGSILSAGAIVLQAGSTLIDGRALTTAAVTLATNTISRPFP